MLRRLHLLLLSIAAFALGLAAQAQDATISAALTVPTQDALMIKHLLDRFRKPSLLDIASLQDAAVRAVISDITNLYDGEWEDREWVYIAVNHEVLIEEGRRSSTQTAVLARKPDADLEDLNFRLSQTTKEILLSLRKAMVTEGKQPWTILDLIIERDGRYDFTFGYGPPPRLNGDLLHAPLTGLLERFQQKRQ